MEKTTEKSRSGIKQPENRRCFLKNGVMGAGAAAAGVGLLAKGSAAFGQSLEDDDRAPVTKGDIAILTFLSALEQVRLICGFNTRNLAVQRQQCREL